MLQMAGCVHSASFIIRTSLFLAILNHWTAMAQVSSSSTLHALEIPEILTRVSHFVKPRHIAACIRVSRTFHVVFAPMIWDTVHVDEYNKHWIGKSPNTLRRYAYCIQSLSLGERLPVQYAALSLPHLETLKLQGCSPDEDCGGHILIIVRHTASLRSLELWLRDDDDENRGLSDQKARIRLWQAVESLTRLEELRLRRVSIIDQDSLDLFLRICQKRLKTLNLQQVWMMPGWSRRLNALDVLDDINANYDIDSHENRSHAIGKLPMLHSLTIASYAMKRSEWDKYALQKKDQIELLVHCTNLQHFDWSHQHPADQLCETLAHMATTANPTFASLGHALASAPTRWTAEKTVEAIAPSYSRWPQVTSIHLHHVKGSDHSLSKLLGSFTRGTLKDVLFRNTGFGEESFQILTAMALALPSALSSTTLDNYISHTQHLTKVVLQGCSSPTSLFLNEFLCSCPQLKWIEGDLIEIRDILGLRDGLNPMIQHNPIQSRQDLRDMFSNDSTVTKDTGRPWVCDGLEHWQIPVFVNSIYRSRLFIWHPYELQTPTLLSPPIQPYRVQHHVFERFSRFKNLETLSICGILGPFQNSMETADAMEQVQGNNPTLAPRDRHSTSPGAGGLELRLDQGLSHLRACRRLGRIQFSSTRQRMRREDVQWMLTNLKSLWGLDLDMHPQQDVRQQLNDMYFAFCKGRSH